MAAFLVLQGNVHLFFGKLFVNCERPIISNFQWPAKDAFLFRVLLCFSGHLVAYPASQPLPHSLSYIGAPDIPQISSVILHQPSSELRGV